MTTDGGRFQGRLRGVAAGVLSLDAPDGVRTIELRRARPTVAEFRGADIPTPVFLDELPVGPRGTDARRAEAPQRAVPARVATANSFDVRFEELCRGSVCVEDQCRRGEAGEGSAHLSSPHVGDDHRLAHGNPLPQLLERVRRLLRRCRPGGNQGQNQCLEQCRSRQDADQVTGAEDRTRHHHRHSCRSASIGSRRAALRAGK
jgi:hypothetical protein